MTSKNHFAAAAFLLMLSAGAADFNGMGGALIGSGPKLFYDFTTTIYHIGQKACPHRGFRRKP